MKKVLSLIFSVVLAGVMTVPTFASCQTNSMDVPQTQTAVVTNDCGYSYEVIGELVNSISPNSITNSASATYKYVIPLRAGNGTQTEHTQDPTYGLTVYNTVNWTTSYEDVFVYAHFDNAQVSFDLSDSKIRLGGIDFHCLTYGIPKPSTGRVYVRQQKDYSVPTSSLSFRGYTYDPGFTYAVGTTQAECQFGCNIEITLLRGNASEWSFVAPNTVFQT